MSQPTNPFHSWNTNSKPRVYKPQNAISRPGETTLAQARILQYSPGFHPPNFCIDEFLNIDNDVPCTSLYTCHACTDSELCDSCIDEFLNIVVDSPVTHSHCTNTIDAGIRQQSDLFVQVQAATKPSFATFFSSVLQAPDWTPPFDLDCDIVVYALGTVLASYEFDFLPP
ncbi:hypothetical protein Lal_00049310 [Lupinus albus]|nr:hypothetical protein Lal_00049310 [Lupinus albus]